jgi:hypothetical protein
MGALDLQLQQQQSGGELTAFLVSPSGNDSFRVAPPAEAIEWQQEWRRQFIAHHDPATGVAVSGDAVRTYGAGLAQALADWLALPECQPLRQALSDHPGLPLRLRLEGDQAFALERLPWELLAPERPLWRLVSAQRRNNHPRPQHSRRPRLLVVVGDAEDLNLEQELQRLEQLRQRGRLDLRVLQGAGSNLVALRQQLLDVAGWDALIFLGHSDPDPNGGGRLHLGDGSWVAAAAFQSELQSAAAKGLALALFNSCSGLDLARSSVASGIDWALCFREPVPCHAASRAFSALLSALEAGDDLFSATLQARQVLSADAGSVGTDLLLSLVAAPKARPFQLPLRKRKQFLLRLARSTPAQAIAASALVALGAVGDLDPANPISTYLLDRRLYTQRLWRSATGQPGPTRPALPVVVLKQRSDAELGATATPGRVSRDLLTKLLQRTPPAQVPKLGLDLVLDEPAPFTAELAQVIRVQARPLLVAGFFGEQVEAKAAGQGSMPLPVLQQAGLQAGNLAVGTPALTGALKWVPLQLWDSLDQRNFAAALSSAPAPFMPADAVIDWSIDWRPLLRRVELSELSSLRAPALVVGTDGSLDRDGEDLFAAPGAMDPALTQIWQGAERKVPGVLIQAVLAQSMSLRHWLTPISQALTTALAGGLGVVLAAAQADRHRRLLLLAAIIVVALPLSWQLAISQLCLLPLALPLAALISTALLRRD